MITDKEVEALRVSTACLSSQMHSRDLLAGSFRDTKAQAQSSWLGSLGDERQGLDSHFP